MEIRQRFERVIEGPFELERSEDRWIALGADVVAMLCDVPARQAAEAWLLERWRAGGVPAPRVLFERDGIQVRDRLRGRTGLDIHRDVESSPLFVELGSVREWLADAVLTPFGERVADSYGDLAARIRRAADPADASIFGPTEARAMDLEAALVAYEESAAPAHAKLLARKREAWLRALPPADALIHSDLHFFNLCTDDAGTITGVWDLGGVGHDHHATELLYAPSLGRAFLARAMAAYGDVSREDVDRAHLRTALGHVLYHHPGQPRHVHVVEWTTAVLESLG